MALSAIVAEVVQNMIGISYPFIIGLMTGVAVIGRILVAVGMAGDAGERDMRPS